MALDNQAHICIGQPDGDWEWITLPMDPDELNETISRLSDNGQHDLIIEDFHNAGIIYTCNLSSALNWADSSQIVDLNNLCVLAEGCEYEAAIEAIVEHNSFKDILEATNAVLQADEIPFYEFTADGSLYDSSRESKFGYTLAEESGLIDPHPKPGSLEETIRCYFDYAQYGRDYSHDVVLTDKGFMELQPLPNLSLYSREEIAQKADAIRTSYPNYEQLSEILGISQESLKNYYPGSQKKENLKTLISLADTLPYNENQIKAILFNRSETVPDPDWVSTCIVFSGIAGTVPTEVTHGAKFDSETLNKMANMTTPEIKAAITSLSIHNQTPSRKA